jgi:hypothetical protein
MKPMEFVKAASLTAAMAIAGSAASANVTITLGELGPGGVIGEDGGGWWSVPTTDPLSVVALPEPNGTFDAKVECSSCYGFIWDATNFILDEMTPYFASAFRIGAAEEGNIAETFSALLGLTGDDVLSKNDVTKIDIEDVDGADPSNFSFSVNTEYFFVKYGVWTSFFRSGGESTVKFVGDPELSNFGEISPIPLPAAGWLLLAGIGGLAAARRMRKAA